jgi:arabinogalactan oligomer/maltooligosaccharide transport system substrate-binding protein
MKRSYQIGIMVLAMAAMLVAACGSSTTTVVKLTFWYTQGASEAPALLKIVSAFNASHPTIQVSAQYVDFSTAHDKFASAARAGVGAPDVVRTDVSWTAEFVQNGFLYGLDSKIKGGTGDFLPAALAYGIVNGHLYSVPDVTDFLVLYYNKTLVATPPITLDDLRTAAQAATNTANNQYGFATPGSSYYLTPFIYADGGDLISNDGKTISVNDAQSVAGLQRVLTMMQDGSVLPIDFTNGYTNMVNGFKNGTVAMIVDNVSDAATLLSGSAFAGSNASNLGIAAFPTGTAGDIPRATNGGKSYAVYAGSNHPNEAITFLNYLTTAQSQSAIATANGTLPTRISAYTAAVLGNSVVAAAQPLLGTAKARPVNPKITQLFGIFDTDLQGALSGQMAAQDALNKVAQDWATALGS